MNLCYFLGVLGSTAQRGMVMLLFYKLNDAINTGWLVRCGINEDICRMHVFQIQAIADIIYPFAFFVIPKAFCCCHFIYFCFCCKAFARYELLRENYSEKAIRIACETDDFHSRLWEQRIMQDNSLKCLA